MKKDLEKKKKKAVQTMDEMGTVPVSLPHGMPMTRRGFLAAGLQSFAGVSVAPSLLTLLGARQAQAAGSALPSFMVVDLAGGFAFPRNFMVYNQNGPQQDDRLNSYSTLGLTSAPASIGVDTRFGLPMPNSSPFRAGLIDANIISPEALANVRLGSFCHKSIDDSPSNQTSAILLVSHLLQGTYLPMGMGLRPTASGGYTGVPAPIAKYRPVNVSSVEDAVSAVTLRGPLGDMNGTTKRAFANAVAELARLQGPSVAGKLQGSKFLEMVTGAYDKQKSLVQQTPEMDARNDAIFQSIYGVTPSSVGAGTPGIAARKATIVMNALRQQSGPGCIYRGGYDYHAGGFDEVDVSTETNLDREVGQEVARIIEAAHRLRQPVMIQLITDGGSVFGTRDGVYRALGDSGVRGMTVLVYYHPDGPPNMVRQQVGHYTNGQAVDTNTVIGSDEIRVAYAVLANFMSAAGRLGEFQKYGGSIFTPAELEKILLFG